MKNISGRQRVINQIKYAGSTNDTKMFTFLLLNNRISVDAAHRYYKQGQDIAKFILDRDKLTIITKGKSNEQIKEVIELPTQKRA